MASSSTASLPALDSAPAAAAPARKGPAAGSPAAAMPGPATASRMDREFIREHQIVERYLGGRLPLRGAQDFEQFCRGHPQLLDEIGLAARIHAGLRLLEAGGQPLPWEAQPAPWWQKLPVLLGAAGLCLLLALVCLSLTGRLAARTAQVAALQKTLAAEPIDPTESTRTLALEPSRSGPTTHSLATIGGRAAELAELQIHMAWSQYRAFDLGIERVGQGRIAILRNLARDSNGDLRLALNSSALGPGDYAVTIEGLTWRGDPVPQAWLTFSVVH